MLIKRLVARNNQVCSDTHLPSRHASNLGETAIYKQFRSRDVAAVVGREKYCVLSSVLFGRVEVPLALE
jgi:hypothetical protein